MFVLVSCIERILVVGFDHAVGNCVEFAYPSFSETEIEQDDSSSSPFLNLPKPFEFLPFIALPDGVHLQSKDHVFFTLPPLKQAAGTVTTAFRKETVYGVACFLQIKSTELKAKDDNVTRSRIQKSVVILSSEPLYGAILTKLEPATRAYFNQGDFSNRQILMDTFESMQQTFLLSNLTAQDYFVGANLKSLFEETRDGHDLLKLFKLLLLEKRIVVEGMPASHVSDVMLSIMSMIPGFLPSLASTPLKKEEKSSGESVEKGNIEKENIDEKEQPVEQAEAATESTVVSESSSPSTLSQLQSCGTPLSNITPHTLTSLFDRLAIPLRLFVDVKTMNSEDEVDSTARLLRPHAVLHQATIISSVHSFLVGTTSALLAEQRGLLNLDAVFQLSDSINELGDNVIEPIDQEKSRTKASLQIVNEKLLSALTLTPADKRFLSFLKSKCFERQNDSDFIGSEEWLRHCFIQYFVSMLVCLTTIEVLSENEISDENNTKTTEKTLNLAPLHDFGESFVALALQTSAFKRWIQLVDPKIYQDCPSVLLAHPCAAVNETRRRAESLISNVTARTAPLQKKVGTGFAIIKKTGTDVFDAALDWSGLSSGRENSSGINAMEKNRAKTTLDEAEKPNNPKSDTFVATKETISKGLSSAGKSVSDATASLGKTFSSWWNSDQAASEADIKNQEDDDSLAPFFDQ